MNTGDTSLIWSAKSSSTLVEEGKPSDYLDAFKAIDGKTDTAWVEGVSGPGIGESITIDFETEIEFESVGIIPGFSRDEQVYFGNNRPKEVQLEFSNGDIYTEVFEDTIGLKKISVYDEDYHNMKAKWLKLTVLDVYRGDRWDDTCISEISVFYYGPK